MQALRPLFPLLTSTLTSIMPIFLKDPLLLRHSMSNSVQQVVQIMRGIPAANAPFRNLFTSKELKEISGQSFHNILWILLAKSRRIYVRAREEFTRVGFWEAGSRGAAPGGGLGASPKLHSPSPPQAASRKKPTLSIYYSC